MPDPDAAAGTVGAAHPPQAEELVTDTPQAIPGAVGADGVPGDRGQSRDLEHESRPGKGENQAGFLKEKDPPGG